MARSKLSAVQAQTFTSEGALTSLEEALGDRDKQIAQLREQRDRAEKDLKEEKELHDRELTDYKMKIHTLESEVEKLQVRFDKALAEKDKLEAKLEYSQSELGKKSAEIDNWQTRDTNRYNDYDSRQDWRQQKAKLEMQNDQLRYVFHFFFQKYIHSSLTDFRKTEALVKINFVKCKSKAFNNTKVQMECEEFDEKILNYIYQVSNVFLKRSID